MNAHTKVTASHQDAPRPSARPSAKAAAVEWKKALREYRRLRAVSDAIPVGTDGDEEAADAYCTAMDHLIINVRVPDAKALQIKLDLIHERCSDFGSWHPGYREAVDLDLENVGLERRTLPEAVERPDISDVEVMAWLNERKVIGPFIPELIDEIRDAMETRRFEAMLRTIRKSDEKMTEFVQALRSHTGLDDFADSVQALQAKDRALLWEDKYSRYIAARDERDAYYRQPGYADEMGDELTSAASRALSTMFITPAPTFEALALKLALYASEDAHELVAAAVYNAHLAADALRLAHRVTGSTRLRDAAIEQIKVADDMIATSRNDDRRAERLTLIAPLRSALGAMRATEERSAAALADWATFRKIREKIDSRGGLEEASETLSYQMDAAEDRLMKTQARCLPTIISQLWQSLDHMTGSNDPAWQKAAISTGDFNALRRGRADLNCELDFVITALAGLEAMEPFGLSVQAITAQMQVENAHG